MVRQVDTLPASLGVDEAADFFCADAHRHRSYPVVEADGRLVGLVTRADALRWQAQRHPGQTLNDVVSDASLPVAHPDDRVGHVTDVMIASDVGRVPIVDARNGVLLGLIARKDLLRLRDSSRSLERERQAYFRRRERPTEPTAKTG